MKKKKKTFSDLSFVMRKLLGNNGCPWDKKQTHRSLIPYLFEEAEELKKAVSKNDTENTKEELGDILLQVVFHSEIARLNGDFNLDDVVNGLCQKLIRRHPHVFGKKRLQNADQVIAQWKDIKKKEKTKKSNNK